MKMILTKRIWQYLISTRSRFGFFVRCPNEVDKNPDSRLKEKSCQCLLAHLKCKSFPDISDFVWLSFDPQTCLRNLRIIFWFLQSGDFWAGRIFLRPFRWPVFRARLWHGWVGGVWGGLIFQGLVAPTVWWATDPTCLWHAQCVHTLQGHMRGRGWKCRVVTCGRSRRQQPGTPGNGFLPPSEWKNCHQLRGVGVGVIRLLRRFQVWGCWNFISLIASVVGSAPQEAVSPAHLPEPGRGGCLAPQGVVCGCDHPGCYTASGRHCRVSTISGPSQCTAAFVEYRRWSGGERG